MKYTIINLQKMFLKKSWIYAVIFLFTSSIYSQIIWQENINCTVDGSHLSGMATGSSILSQNSLAPTNENGWVEIDNITGIGSKGLHRFGLLPIANLASVDWTSGYYFTIVGSLLGTSLNAYDHGVSLGNTSFNPLIDVLRIEKTGNIIYYKKNGLTVFQVTETTQALTDYKIIVNTSKGLNIGHDISTSLEQGTTSGGGGTGDATVTLAHSRTKNLEELCASADILIAALGAPGFIKAHMVKEGAVVIDVGTTRVPSTETKSGFRLKGDVVYDEVAPKCSYITPVPGGVGPMTRVSLLSNTLKAAKGNILS